MVEFNRGNPAADAFQRGMDFALRQQRGEQAIRREDMAFDFDQQANPSRLRSITAGADTAEANAQVTRETAPDKITISREAARQAPIATEQAGFNLQHSRDLAPYQVGQAAAGLRTSNANATAAELEGFYKSLDLIRQGDVEGGKAVAQAYGQQIPDEILTNNTFIGALARITDEAKARYPNSPQRQKQYIDAALEGMRDAAEGGSRMADPSYQYQVPNAPEPPSVAGQGSNVPADVKTAEWLVAQGVASGAAEAWEMVRMSRTNPEEIRAKIYQKWIDALTEGQFSVDGQAVAVQAQELTEKTMQFLSQTPTVQSPATATSPFPEFPDARQAPDGKWYVQQGEQWMEVQP